VYHLKFERGHVIICRVAVLKLDSALIGNIANGVVSHEQAWIDMTVHRPYNRNEDPEGIPLTALPIYEERDLTEEHLPTYNEAVATPSQSPTGDDERRPPPEPTSTNVPRPTRRTSLHKGGRPIADNGWVGAAGVGYLLLGIGLLVAGIVWYFSPSSLSS